MTHFLFLNERCQANLMLVHRSALVQIYNDTSNTHKNRKKNALSLFSADSNIFLHKCYLNTTWNMREKYLIYIHTLWVLENVCECFVVKYVHSKSISNVGFHAFNLKFHEIGSRDFYVSKCARWQYWQCQSNLYGFFFSSLHSILI